jgi:hypothetical protein
MVDLIKLGMWAHKKQVNELSLIKLKNDYEKKISKLQEIIDGTNG